MLYRLLRTVCLVEIADSSPTIVVVSVGDWIGLLQTVVLVITVAAAISGLRLTTRENAHLRAERRLQPRRELLLDVVRELKELAAQVEVVVPGIGYFDSSALAARKHQLGVSLHFFPDAELPLTRSAADRHDLTQDVARAAIAPAAAELAAELRRLELAVIEPAQGFNRP